MPKFVSAQFHNTDLGLKIRAVDENDRVWWLDDECTQGNWLEYLKDGGVVVPADTPPVPPTPDELDLAELNAIMLAQGSVGRATLEILFGVIKGTIPVTPSLTKSQFKTMVKNMMRTP